MQCARTLAASLVLTIMGFMLCSSGFTEGDKDFVPGEDSGFYYTIQKGDTLWDLSQKFYLSEWDWPGLWEMNKNIKNPHWIYPGRKIRVFLKDKMTSQPESAKIEPVKQESPPEKIVPSFSFSEIDRIGFVKKSMEPSFGSVIRDENGKMMMSSNDIIYIKPSGKETLMPDQIYNVCSTSPVEKKIKDQITFAGIRHIIHAQVKILQNKTTYVTAKVLKSYRPIIEGNMLIAFKTRESVFQVDNNPASIQGAILCSENDDMMINDTRIAFINLGTGQVKPGQIYSVMRGIGAENSPKPLMTTKDKKEEIKFDNITAGKLIVLHTEDIASTVMILSSKYEIKPDDIIN